MRCWAVGDAAFQKKCLGRMSEVARAGRTVLFVSHNIAVVTTLCSRGLYLENGSLKSAGPIEEIANQYLQDALPRETGMVDFVAARRAAAERSFSRILRWVQRTRRVRWCVGAETRIRFKYEAAKADLAAHFVVNIFDRQQVRVLCLDSKTAGEFAAHFSKTK